jgi:transaldolase
VRSFGARVSVELHPALADDIDQTVHYAERYYAVCPERFIIKIPLSPDGICATARVQARGVPVNFTLGFSARQNYLVTLLARPAYVNVFLGRLNQVVSENGLGDGKYVGEKATLASQAAVRAQRTEGRTETRQIAASMRTAAQMTDLAGVDVYTVPTKVVKEFLASPPPPEQIKSQLDRAFEVTLAPDADTQRISVLWTIDDRLRALGDALNRRHAAMLNGEDLRQADADFGTGLFHRFSPEEAAAIRAQGKIPDWGRWQKTSVALDDLMTQSALQSFAKDQAALEDRLRTM